MAGIKFPKIKLPKLKWPKKPHRKKSKKTSSALLKRKASWEEAVAEFK